jgi:biopolymer transport protein TolQ
MNGNILALISKESLMIVFVMLTLAIFSVISWAIVIFKLVEYSKAKKNSSKFIGYFRKTKNFSDINKFAMMFKNNPLAEIFKYGYKELSTQLGVEKPIDRRKVDSVERSLMRASKNEITRLERLNGFLATTASVAPFIGLFGTVWGIMMSFIEIDVQSNANITTVAPGIASALIATALGLFAAIPAVIFYNLLLNKLKVIISTMEEFMLEFLNISEKIG